MDKAALRKALVQERLNLPDRLERAEALQQVLDMGVVEGASGAINQIDALVA